MAKVVHNKPDEFKQLYRQLNGVIIIFYSKEAIYAKQGFNKICFNRWFCEKGTFQSSWSPFQESLKHSKHITSLLDIIKIAEQYEVNVCGCYNGFPEITNNMKKII